MIVGFHPSNMFTWGPMQKRSTKVASILFKNIWEEVILYCFRNCFPVLENIATFTSLNKIHATKYMYMQALIYSVSFSCLFLFSFICVQIKHENLSQKTFLLRMVPHDHWTQNQKSVTDEILNPKACTSNDLVS